MLITFDDAIKISDLSTEYKKLMSDLEDAKSDYADAWDEYTAAKSENNSIVAINKANSKVRKAKRKVLETMDAVKEAREKMLIDLAAMTSKNKDKKGRDKRSEIEKDDDERSSKLKAQQEYDKMKRDWEEDLSDQEAELGDVADEAAKKKRMLALSKLTSLYTEVNELDNEIIAASDRTTKKSLREQKNSVENEIDALYEKYPEFAADFDREKQKIEARLKEDKDEAKSDKAVDLVPAVEEKFEQLKKMLKEYAQALIDEGDSEELEPYEKRIKSLKSSISLDIAKITKLDKTLGDNLADEFNVIKSEGSLKRSLKSTAKKSVTEIMASLEKLIEEYSDARITLETSTRELEKTNAKNTMSENEEDIEDFFNTLNIQYEGALSALQEKKLDRLEAKWSKAKSKNAEYISSIKKDQQLSKLYDRLINGGNSEEDAKEIIDNGLYIVKFDQGYLSGYSKDESGYLVAEVSDKASDALWSEDKKTAESWAKTFAPDSDENIEHIEATSRSGFNLISKLIKQDNQQMGVAPKGNISSRFVSNDQISSNSGYTSNNNYIRSNKSNNDVNYKAPPAVDL